MQKALLVAEDNRHPPGVMIGFAAVVDGGSDEVQRRRCVRMDRERRARRSARGTLWRHPHAVSPSGIGLREDSNIVE
jgi:hypothetical protein